MVASLSSTLFALERKPFLCPFGTSLFLIVFATTELKVFYIVGNSLLPVSENVIPASLSALLLHNSINTTIDEVNLLTDRHQPVLIIYGSIRGGLKIDAAFKKAPSA